MPVIWDCIVSFTAVWPSQLPYARRVNLLTQSGRRPCRKKHDKQQWINLSHSKVGGSTLVPAIFRLNGFEDAINIPPDLSRNLSHVVKYTIWSSPGDSVLTIPHYKLSIRLTITKLDWPFLLPLLSNWVGSSTYSGPARTGGIIRITTIPIVVE